MQHIFKTRPAAIFLSTNMLVLSMFLLIRSNLVYPDENLGFSNSLMY